MASATIPKGHRTLAGFNEVEAWARYPRGLRRAAHGPGGASEGFRALYTYMEHKRPVTDRGKVPGWESKQSGN